MKLAARSFLCIGLTALALDQSGLALAPQSNWVRNPGNGHWYAVDSTQRTWAAAEKQANELGGYLARIRSAAEQQFVLDLLQTPGHAAWVGVTEQGSPGLWHFPDGEPAPHLPWCPGEPNNSGGVEHWVVTNWCSSGGWNDEANGNLHASVIEVDPVWHSMGSTGSGSELWVRLSTMADSWTRHRDLARAMGAELLSLHSAQETAFLIANLVPEIPPATYQGCSACRIAYIGLSDELQEGQWQWSDGSPLDYVDWASGEPTGSHHSEDYVVFNWDGFGRWADVREIEDARALYFMESTDCNGDGVPDDYELFLGLPVDANQNGVHDACELLVTPYCFCLPGSNACNFYEPAAGCTNSTGVGALLTASGTTSVSADDLVLQTSQLPPGQFGLYYMGGAATQLPFGNGVRCVAPGASGLYRYYVQSTQQGGMTLGPGIVLYSQTYFPPSGHILPGSRWYFQCWYRDPMGFCPGGGKGFNLSNALDVTFF